MSGCHVCGLPDDGYHFKALTCRACAAFFRRSIVKRAKYTCKFTNDCPMNKELRKACAACRLNKCRAVGMDERDVQWNRDTNGPLKTPRNSDGSRAPRNRLDSMQQRAEVSPFPMKAEAPMPATYYPNNSTVLQPTAITIIPQNISPTAASSSGFSSMGSVSGSSSSCESPSSSSSGSIPANVVYQPVTTTDAYLFQSDARTHQPLLGQLLEYVQEYCRGERALFTMLYPDRVTNGDSIVFYPCKHTELVEMERGCLSLIQQLIHQINPKTVQLPPDVKMSLLRSFFYLWSPLRKSYLTSTVFPDPEDTRFAPHYGQYAEKTLYFYQDDENPKMSFDLSEGIHRKSTFYMKKMRALRPREIEFAALTGIVLANESDLLFNNNEMSSFRDQIYQELHDDIFSNYPYSEAPNRFGSIICLLQDAQNMSREIQETVIMCKLFSPHKDELDEIYSP